MRSDPDDDAIDAAIATAARALTSAEPPAALRAAVRERIGRGALANVVRRKGGWFVPATAAGVAVVALILGRSPSPAPDTPVNQPRSSEPRLVTVPSPPDDGPGVEAVTSPRPVRRLAETLEPTVEEMEPLIPPITIPPLETTQIVVDAGSGVMPIEIEPLRIEPLQGE